ncbi:MAG: REP-associated tyrosine transposase [Terracidiphilus sp.]
MARPVRHAPQEHTISSARTFFATTKTDGGRRLLQSERNAVLFIDVLRSYMAAGKFEVHDFVVMPDHVHLLLTVRGDSTIEKAMQLIKGRFSYRLKHECGYLGEVWQVGFSESRADDAASFERYRGYIARNPVKAGLAVRVGEYPFCYAYLAEQKRHRG